MSSLNGIEVATDVKISCIYRDNGIVDYIEM